jgi:hypothetical protein
MMRIMVAIASWCMGFAFDFENPHRWAKIVMPLLVIGLFLCLWSLK